MRQMSPGSCHPGSLRSCPPGSIPGSLRSCPRAGGPPAPDSPPRVVAVPEDTELTEENDRQWAVCVYCASGPRHPELLAVATGVGSAIANRGWTLVSGGG